MFEQFQATPAQVQERLEICRGCEFVKVLPVLGEQCTVCNCLMAVKTKMKFTECPKQKWLAIDL